jgi:hypothetical protein
MRRSIGCDPDLGRVAASSARLHPRSPPRRQERERCADPIAGSVASEQIADRGPGHALGFSVLERTEEVGQQFSVTRERIRQIEAKALRKLKHPSRSRMLRSFLHD